MRIAISLLTCLFILMPASGQERVLTAQDYQRAERKLSQNTSPLVYSDAVRPNWMDGDRFWYRNTVKEGAEFIIVDPEEGTRERAFDHGKLARTLSAETGQQISALTLPFSSFEFNGDHSAITFSVRPDTYTCNLGNYTCSSDGMEGEQGGQGGGFGRFRRNEVASPDGTREAFIRDYNLWIRDLESGEETQLTTDGVEQYGYATNNAGWTKGDNPILVWSPDSKKIATFQHDGRGVGNMYLVSTKPGHPELESWQYPMPGDSLIFRIERVVVHVDGNAPRVVRMKMPPDAHRSTITDHIAYRGGWADVEWSDDSDRLFFVSSSRDHKSATLRETDINTGDVRTIFNETVDTFYESGASTVNWHVMPETDEFIWFSEQSNWGHLYLHDLTSGKLKHPITQGDWNVLDVLEIDEANRTILFRGSCREEGDPYFQYLYRINMDGTGLELLTPEIATHSWTFTPSSNYFIDSYSTPVAPPVNVLRTADGEMVMQLEQADISELEATGWKPPVPFTTKARDGKTDLYGLLFKPTNFDPNTRYPIINYLYPGPQTGSVGSRSFQASRRDLTALAELGFVAVEVDAMGTPGRSKSFHEAYYGDMGDNGLPDQVTTIQQLAERNPWMDIDRVGIYGHSGGGFASTAGILRYPDFYKVAVSQAGNHDNATYEDDWGEKWQGLLEEYPDGTNSYTEEANYNLAKNLKGKLLIAHGTMDNNVPPNNTLMMVDALMKANKDFDLLMFPNSRHGFGNTDYMMRRRWDYFVKNLMQAQPPKEYEFGNLPTDDSPSS